MKIAIVSQPFDGVLPPRQGSIGLWSFHVARRLAEAHEVTVYVPHGGGSRPRIPDDGVSYRFVPVVPERALRAVDRIVSRLRDPSRAFVSSPWYHREYVTGVVRHLSRLGPDVVHVHNFAQYLPPIRNELRDACLVLHMNCDWLTLHDRRRLERATAAADVVLGSSGYLMDGARRRFPRLADRCQVVFNGVDTDLFAPPPEPRDRPGNLILAVGRISPEKGLHVLLEAFLKLRRTRPEARLRVVGPPGALPASMLTAASSDPRVRALDRFSTVDYGRHLREMIPPEAKGSVEWIDFVPQGELVRHYHEADVLVASPLLEAFGIPVAEAAATGLPAIVARVGGLPEVVEDGRSGVVVAPDDPAVLASALERVLADDALRNRMGTTGRERARELFSWDRIARQTNELYEGALDTKR